MTHDRSSSSGEPLDLAILDEEFGEVLRVSVTGAMGEEKNRVHTQSISFTGGVEFSFRYFQIG